MEFEIYDGLNGDEQFMVKPLAGSGSTGIMLSTLWNQSGVARVGNNTTVRYNEYCPYISGSSTHSVTGCTNTAAGQIIYYFIEKGGLDLQLTLNAGDAYTDDNGLQVNADGSTPGTVSFSVINSKLAEYDLASADDAAALVYACGVVQEADYGSSTGTAWSLDLFYRSGFECANRAYLWAGNSVFWGAEGAISEGGFEVLIENLTAGRVVGTSYPGHALVIDGYDSDTDKFHINYGWGNSTSTSWYTRAEMNAIGYHDFIYDLMPEGEKDLFVTDSRIYGTGTLARALELANGTKGANTVTVDKSLAGVKLAGNMNFRFKEETTVRNFNMELMTFSSSSYGYGFISENDAVGIFTDFTGALITVGGNYGYAFSFGSSDRLELSTDQAVIYAGNYRVNGDAGAGAEAVLASLRTSQKEDSDVAGFVIDTSQNAYSVYAGAGNDLIVFANNTIVAGKISLQGGDDTLSVTGGSHVYGDINCGDGSNVITIDSTSSVTGCFYGTADLNFVLTAVPDDEASFVITRNVSNLRSNAAITVDVSKATAGKYTLITADSSASYISNLDYIQLTVTAGMQESFSLSVNGGADCRYAELLREGNSLVLRVKGYDDEDKTAPAVPASLTASVSGNSVQLDWGDSTDNNRVEGYFFRYGTSASLSGEGEFVTDSEAVISGLENGTWYYQVRARDGSGNLSNWSTVRSFTVNYTPQYVTLESGGLLVSAAAAMTGKTVSGSGAKMNVSSGGTASRTLVLDGGIQSVSSGGKGSDTKVSSGGFAQILFSGTMKDLTIYESGSAAVLRSGTLSNATVSGGVLHLSSGGAASGVTVKSGGELVLRPNGSARNVTVSQGGTILGFTLLSGTSSYNTLTCYDFSLNNAAVKSGTSAFAYSGAKIENVDVYSGGRLYVLSGASATLIYNPWRGGVTSSAGARVEYLSASEKVYYGGFAYGILSSGAALNSLTVSYGQEIYVYSGGSAKEITLLSSGKIYISSGGTVSSLQVSAGGIGYLSGGTLQSVTVESSGCVIGDQGVLSNTTVKSGGSVLLSGGRADETYLSGGKMFVKSGANGGNAKIFSGGTLILSSGASGGTIETYVGGNVTIYSGASAENILIDGSAYAMLNKGVEIGTLTLKNFASGYVVGKVANAVAGSRSFLVVSSGAQIDQIIVSSAGRVYFEENALIDCPVFMERGGVMILDEGVKSNINITVNGTLRTEQLSVGSLDMQNHTLTLDLRERFTTDSYVIDAWRNIKNAKLAITVSATQNSGIYEIARYASTFNGAITVNCGGSSGTLTLDSSLTLGKSTYSLTVDTFGSMYLSVENSGTNTTPSVSDYTPGTWSTDWAQASKYAKEHNKLIFACYGDPRMCGFAGYMSQKLFNDPEFIALAEKHLVLLYETVPAGKSYGGSPAARLLDHQGNTLAQKSGYAATAYEAWMTWLKVYTGEVAGAFTISGALVESHAASSVKEITNSTYVAGVSVKDFQVQSGGSLHLVSGGSAQTGKVATSGFVYVFSGGRAADTTIAGGVLDIFSAGIANSTVIDAGWITVYNSGTANATVVNSGGKIYISNGGTADSTTVNSGGGISISSGGTAENTQIVTGGRMYVYSGGVAEAARVSGGTVYISGGTVCSTTVSSGGIVQLYSGGTVSGLTIASGAKAYLRPGTEVTGINAASGAILGFDVAPDTYFQGTYAGKAFEQKSGVLSNYDIHSGCHVSVCSGGTVSEGSVLSGGTLCLLSGASAADAVVNGGFMDVFSSGIAEDTVICSGGYVRVRDFGSAIGTLIESGASMYVHSSNGYAYDTLISGFGRVYDGATMSKVTIASGGSFHLWRGGILKDAEIQYGGLLDIRESAPILEGDILVNGQLKASYNQNINSKNANIVIDLTNRTEADDYSIINLDYLSDANFSISVSADQGTGIYKLASGAANWDSSFSLSVNNSNSVDISFGNVISVSGKNYTISKGTDNALVLSIADSANLPDDKFKSFSAYTEQGPYSFGLGKISEFTFDDATIKAGFICCISGMQSKDWIMLEDQTFTLGEFFHPKIYDAEKIDVISVDDYWCGQLTEINMLNWINTLNRAGYQSGDDFATELALLGNTEVSPSNYIVEKYGIPWGNWAKKIGDIEEKNMFNKLQNVEILLRNGCVSWLQIYHGTPENITGGHATTLLGFTFDTSYAPDDPRYYSGVIIADSDDTKRSYDDISSPPERIRIVRLLWDEDMQNYWFEGKDRHFIENIWTFQNNSVPETADLTWYQPNSWTTQMTVSPVLDADKDTPVLWSDEKIYLNFAITNQGLAESGKFYVSLYVDDKLLEIFKVDSMEAADISAIQNYEIGKLSAGSHTIKAVIDSENNVAEAFETNNIYSKTIEVTQAGEKAYFGAAEGFVISTGVAVKDIVLSSGGRIHLRGEKALLENASVVTKAQLFVSSGGGLKDCEITASCYIYSGASAQNTTINSSGYLSVSNGRTTGTVNNGGTEDVFFGAVTESATVCSGGRILLAGGSALDAVISSGGRLHVRSYASAASYASNTVVCSGGYMEVYDYSTAEKTVVHSGGSMYVFTSGAYAYDTLISGFGRVYDGATMSKVTIASGGSFHLWRGGILKDVEIHSGGLLDIRESSSILSGDLLVAGQLKISYDHKTDFSNADIVVDMSGRTVTDTYSIVNLNYIGETTISIKVSDSQARGTYKFASNAALFTDTITIGNGTKDFGTLTIGGAAVEYGDYSYSLVQSGQYLNLTVTASKIPAPTVTADVTTPTNKEVTLTAVFDEFSTVREYRIDGGNWQNCTGTVKVSQNSKVEFRCKDAQNVYSDVSVYNVTNIDKVAPVITVTGNTERPARKVILTASVDDGSSILYSTDNASWNRYTAPVTVTANGTVFFKSTDAAGNTAQKSVAVSNIDLTLPDAPAVTADVTAPTNGKVTLTIHFSDGVAKKEYSADKRNWQLCSGTVEAAENGTFYFREMDAAGTYSEISSYTVSNIDRAAPDIPAALNIVHPENKWYLDWQDAADKGIAGTTGYYYRYGKNSVLNGSGVFIETSRADITSLEEGRWYFQVQSVDAAGNKSPWTTVFETVIDRSAPVITLDANTETPLRSALLSARVDDGSTIMYSTDRVKWYEYTSTITVTDNGTWYFKSTDAAGNTAQNSITFTNIDHTLPALPVVVPDITAPTRNNVTVSVIFTANAVVPQYSTNGLRWYTYTAPITLTGNTTLYFREKNAAGEYSEIVSYTVSNIDKEAPDIPENLNFVLAGGTLAVKWNDAGDNGSAGVTEYNVRYGSSPALNGQGETVKTNQFDLLNIAAGTWYFQVQSVDAAGNVSFWSEAVAYTVGSDVSALQGSASGVSWKDASGTGNYTVEYSKDNFAHLLSLESSSCGVDTYNVPAGNYRWRVDGVEGPGFTAGEKNSAAIFKSDADGVQDLFFGTAHSLWSKGYAAEHQTTGERIMLAGKNNISDIFEGSSDAAILVLTDDANGDALFVDDIYSALGSQARFARMSEIRAGAGDDIVDMTSERWTYSGSNIRIFGGDGNDVLWGGAESNILSGDAGNDRLAGASGNDILIGGSGNDLLLGGGGDDIFIFGAGWGEDTVEQLTSGSVTLWFESGSSANWNKETLTYSDGECKVSVKGCADVMLKFGDDSSLPENCFDGALTDKVFS